MQCVRGARARHRENALALGVLGIPPPLFTPLPLSTHFLPVPSLSETYYMPPDALVGSHAPFGREM